MMLLDKAGREYTPMSEAEKAAARARPYPAGFAVWGDVLRARQAQRATEPVRVYHAPEARAIPETIGKALSRKTTRRRRAR